jgi:hypothetical protein
MRDEHCPRLPCVLLWPEGARVLVTFQVCFHRGQDHGPVTRTRTSPITVYVGVVECAPAPASSSLTRARRMDGFCNQNADQLCSLAGLSLLTVYVVVVECAPASLGEIFKV